MITEAQTQALAAFVARIRADWDQPGIVAAIRKASTLGNPAEIGTALCRLAGNRELRTPAMLADPGTHWHDTTVAARVWPVMCETHPDVRASRCDTDGPCARAVAQTDHATGAARVRAEYQPRPRPIRAPERPATDLDAVRKRIDEEVGQ